MRPACSLNTSWAGDDVFGGSYLQKGLVLMTGGSLPRGALLGVLALHVWLAVWLYAVVGTLCGNLAERTYEARM